MTESIIKEALRLRPNIGHISDALLEDFIKDAFEEVREFLYYLPQEALPDNLAGIIKKVVMSNINRIGAEGISSQSFSGVSYSFLEALSESDKRKLKSRRRFGWPENDE